MEGFKQEGVDTKKESALRQGLKVLTVLGALGGVFGSASSAQAESATEFPIESIDADAEGDASESLKGTAEAIVEEVLKDGKISVIEAEAVEYAWDEMSEYMPQEVTSGPYGETIKELIGKLKEIAEAQEGLDSLKNEFAVLGMKMKIEQERVDFENLNTAMKLDPFAEEDANAVEYISENK